MGRLRVGHAGFLPRRRGDARPPRPREGDQQMSIATKGSSDPEPRFTLSAAVRRVRVVLSAALAAVLGLLPHVLHHVGPLAGAALSPAPGARCCSARSGSSQPSRSFCASIDAAGTGGCRRYCWPRSRQCSRSARLSSARRSPAAMTTTSPQSASLAPRPRSGTRTPSTTEPSTARPSSGTRPLRYPTSFGAVLWGGFDRSDDP